MPLVSEKRPGLVKKARQPRYCCCGGQRHTGFLGYQQEKKAPITLSAQPARHCKESEKRPRTRKTHRTKRLKKQDEAINTLKKEVRETGSIPESLRLKRKLRTLQDKCDEAWRDYNKQCPVIEKEKARLVRKTQKSLRQKVTHQCLFTISFEVH